jgi:hypothetical protein
MRNLPCGWLLFPSLGLRDPIQIRKIPPNSTRQWISSDFQATILTRAGLDERLMFEQTRENDTFGPFLLHLLIAVLGTLLITGLLSFLLSYIVSRNVVSMIALGPSFAIPILSGVVVGYYLANVLPRGGARWVWVAPAVLLVVNIGGALTSSYERNKIWVNEFGPQSRCTACLDETLLTAPLAGCIGYSLGAACRKRQAA